MTAIATARPTIHRPEPEHLVDYAQLAAGAFLARYSGGTLKAYRHDLRGFFQWAADNAVAVRLPVPEGRLQGRRSVRSMRTGMTSSASIVGRLTRRTSPVLCGQTGPLVSHQRVDGAPHPGGRSGQI